MKLTDAMSNKLQGKNAKSKKSNDEWTTQVLQWRASTTKKSVGRSQKIWIKRERKLYDASGLMNK